MTFHYSCNRCPRTDVTYGDWLPIIPKVHWCRNCVTDYFDELPESEKERAARFRDNYWGMTKMQKFTWSMRRLWLGK